MNRRAAQALASSESSLAGTQGRVLSREADTVTAEPCGCPTQQCQRRAGFSARCWHASIAGCLARAQRRADSDGARTGASNEDRVSADAAPGRSVPSRRGARGPCRLTSPCCRRCSRATLSASSKFKTLRLVRVADPGAAAPGHSHFVPRSRARAQQVRNAVRFFYLGKRIMPKICDFRCA